MATVQEWQTPESLATALTTDLNSLANNALSAVSAAIDNITTDRYKYMELELVLASLTPTGSPYCAVYMVKCIDGTNYEDLTVSAVHEIIAIFPMATAVAAKRINISNIVIPPCLFKLAVQNVTGPAFAASGNTLKYRRYKEQDV